MSHRLHTKKWAHYGEDDDEKDDDDQDFGMESHGSHFVRSLMGESDAAECVNMKNAPPLHLQTQVLRNFLVLLLKDEYQAFDDEVYKTFKDNRHLFFPPST